MYSSAPIPVHRQPSTQMNTNSNTQKRVIGLDVHPDSFTAAIIEGQTPGQARVRQVFNHILNRQLANWAIKYSSQADVIVLEASGNSFEFVRALRALGRQALVLESRHLGRLKESHANNDRISAVRIGKAYLAGTTKEVWVPDPLTQERRDCFHAHNKAVRRCTQMQNRIESYLSDNGVRLPATLYWHTPEGQEQIRKARDWSPRQWRVLENYLLELGQAHQQREKWKSLIAQEVIEDPLLLSLVRLCGVRETIAFALGAIIGDIKRFASPKALVKYIGLDPAFDDSGVSQWRGGIGGHGRGDLRALLIQAAHSVIRSRKHPLNRWAFKLLQRKGHANLVAAAVARRLVVAVWYLMNGRWTALEELDGPLRVKVGKIITSVGKSALKSQGKTRKDLREQITQSLTQGRGYLLDRMPRMFDRSFQAISEQDQALRAQITSAHCRAG